MRKLSSARLTGKKVILRADLDVPLKGKKVVDTSRLVNAIPTIQYILKKQPKQLIIIGHMGRPKGTDKTLSLAPVAKKLQDLLKRKVKFGPGKEKIIMLENLRFDEREKKNEPKFAKELADLGDIYVDNAYAVSHRDHASLTGICDYILSYPGLLIENELKKLSILKKPKKPYLAIVGGGKADKINLIKELDKKASDIVIGGVLANMIFKAKGLEIGKSKCDDSLLETAKKIKSKKVHLPVDLIVANSLDSVGTIVDSENVPKNSMILDIGPESREDILKLIRNAKTIYFGGPVGVYEVDEFSQGTKVIIEELAKAKAKVIIGGGDSSAAVHMMKLGDKMYHVSTGGGASLTFVEGKKLPAIEALKKNSCMKFKK